MSRFRLGSLLDAVPRRLLLPTGIWILVVASVVSWRRGAIYSGGMDATVVAKAVVALVAAGAALLLWWRAAERRRVSPYPVLIVLAIVWISLLGAGTTGALMPNIVLAVRVGLLAGTILLLLSATSVGAAVGCLLGAMAAVGLLAAATGLPFVRHAGAQAGRLGGGIPPLEPNELASLLLPPAIGLLYLVVRRGLASWATLGLLTLAAVLFLTGSRTALAMLLVGGLLALLAADWAGRGVVAAMLLAIVALVVLVAFTPVLSDLALRGEGIDRLLTLNSRTISWGSVFALPKDDWSWWLGHGLSMKTIPVVGQYWSAQVFDSSWVSSIAQDGVLGTVLLALYAVGTLIAVIARPGMRPWALPLVGPILLRSFVENGLIESSVTFTLFFVLAASAWPRSDALRTDGGRTEGHAAAGDPLVVREPLVRIH